MNYEVKVGKEVVQARGACVVCELVLRDHLHHHHKLALEDQVEISVSLLESIWARNCWFLLQDLDFEGSQLHFFYNY
jgi:hypothetical protein